MKLYKNTTKRIAKKKIGSESRFRKLIFALGLKKGDIITTCKGFNEKIEEITPEWTDYKLKKGLYIFDFDIFTQSGGSCSWMNCCTFPTQTKEEIIEYFLSWTTPESIEFCEETGWNFHKCPMVVALREGKEVFTETGELIEDFRRQNGIFQLGYNGV